MAIETNLIFSCHNGTSLLQVTENKDPVRMRLKLFYCVVAERPFFKVVWKIFRIGLLLGTGYLSLQ